MFLKLDYLNKENLNYMKESLSQTFLINMDSIKKEVKTLKLDNSENIWEKIHYICMKNLKNYHFIAKDYFPSIENNSDYTFINAHLENCLSQYMLQNIKLNLYLSNTNINLSKNTLPFNKSVTNYHYKFYSEIIRNKTHKSINKLRISIKKYRKVLPKKFVIRIRKNTKIRTAVNNLRTTFKEFRNQQNILSKNLVFYKKELSEIKKPHGKREEYEIYGVLSDIFVHTLKHWNKCKYNYSNFDKTNSFKDIKNFSESFLKINIDLNDLYYFERIYNIRSTLSIYFYPLISINNISENDLLTLVKILLPIIYLPNVLENDSIVNCFIDLYKNLYSVYNINEFSDGVKRLCFDLSFYFIPLYNMLYSNILNIHCETNKNNINKFVNKNLDMDANLNSYKESFNIFLDKNKFDKHFNFRKSLFKEKNLIKDKTLDDIIFFITDNFNIELFNRTLLIDSIGKFDKNISSIVTNIDEYQTNFKNFILGVLDSKDLNIFK